MLFCGRIVELRILWQPPSRLRHSSLLDASQNETALNEVNCFRKNNVYLHILRHWDLGQRTLLLLVWNASPQHRRSGDDGLRSLHATPLWAASAFIVIGTAIVIPSIEFRRVSAE
jgi:hypothetical protein